MMSVLSENQKRFSAVANLKVEYLIVPDEIFDPLIDACQQQLRQLDRQDEEQRLLFRDLTVFMRRLSSFLGPNFGREEVSDLVLTELHGLIFKMSSFDGFRLFSDKFSMLVKLLVNRGLNKKYEALSELLESGGYLGLTKQIVWRGHKWRTLDVDSEVPFNAYSDLIDFSTSKFDVKDLTINSCSPHLLNRQLLRNLFLRGGTKEMLTLLYSKEYFQIPKQINFLASQRQNDAKLITYEIVANNKKLKKDTSLDRIEIENVGFGDDSSGLVAEINYKNYIKILLDAGDEVILESRDSVFVLGLAEDQDLSARCLVSDLEEGMKLILRPPTFVEAPHIFLERSEIWRSRLKYMVLTGGNLKDIAAAVSEKISSKAVTSSSVNQWALGDIMGPAVQEVFDGLLDFLVDEGELEAAIVDENRSLWWSDIKISRADQTAMGMQNKDHLIASASQLFGSVSSEKFLAKIELAEILEIEKIRMPKFSDADLGKSNQRQMRVLI